MDIHTDILIKTFPELSRHEPKNIDSSALGEVKKCPKAYFFRYVLGYTDKVEAQYFIFGKCYHKFKEVIEKSYKLNSTKDLDKIVAEGIQSALVLWGTTKDLIPPTKYFWLSKARLIQCMMVAGKHWKNEKSIGKIEVLETEQPFIVHVTDTITRSGRFDQVIKLNNKIWGRDFKTTTQNEIFFERGLDPNDQFIGYTFAQQQLTGEPTQGQLVEVIYNERPTKTDPKNPEIKTNTVTYVKEQIDLWIREQEIWDAQLRMYREKDLYPKNEKSCYNCKYHSICKLKGDNQQLLQLKSNYKVEVWDNSYED